MRVRNGIFRGRAGNDEGFSRWTLTASAALIAVLGAIAILNRSSQVPVRPPTQSPDAHTLCDIAPANDVGAVEAAINGCSDGSLIRFPARASYVLDDTIFVKDRHNLVIDGNSSTFKISTDGQTKPSINRIAPGYDEKSKNGGNWMLLRGTNITLKNLKAIGSFPPPLNGEPRDIVRENRPEYVKDVDGDGKIRYAEFMSNFGVYGTDGAYLQDLTGVAPWGDTVTTATDLYVDNFFNEHGGEPKVGNFAKNVFVKRVNSESPSRHCYAITSGVNMWVEDSYCKSAWYGGTDQELDDASHPMEGIHFLRNTFEGFTSFGYLLPVAGTKTKDISVEGNLFKTAPDVKCNPTIGMGGYPDVLESIMNISIENNTIVTYGTAINLDSIAGGKIANNKIIILKDQVPGCNTADGTAPIIKVSPRSTGVVQEGNGPDALGADGSAAKGRDSAERRP